MGVTVTKGDKGLTMTAQTKKLAMKDVRPQPRPWPSKASTTWMLFKIKLSSQTDLKLAL